MDTLNLILKDVLSNTKDQRTQMLFLKENRQRIIDCLLQLKEQLENENKEKV